MDQTVDQFSSFVRAIIEQAKKDLQSSDQLAIKAALYFFLKPAQHDDGDLHTFTGLCAAVRINADGAARAIFDGLPPHQQERIRGLLQDRGYTIIRSGGSTSI